MAKAKRTHTTARNDQFLRLWSSYSDIQLQPEYQFAPPRRWRFDFAHLPSKVAVEIEGICWYGRRTSRHQTAAGVERDCEKYNAAAERGWVVLRYTQRDLDQRPMQTLEQIERIIKARTWINVDVTGEWECLNEK